MIRSNSIHPGLPLFLATTGLSFALVLGGASPAIAASLLVKDVSTDCTTQQQSTSNVTVGLSVTFNSCFPAVDGETILTHASAKGSFTDTLVLGAAGDVTITSLNQGAFANQGVTSSVDFSDTITLLGGTTGTPAFLELEFAVEGSTSHAGGTSFQVDGQLQAQYGGTTTSRIFSGDTTVTLSIPFIFGTPQLIHLALLADAIGSVGPMGLQFTGSSSFSNTASLRLVTIVDGTSNTIAVGEVHSGSGLTYPGGGSPVVPEPTTLTLVAIGLGAAVRRRLKDGPARAASEIARV